jgi:hypothetical protein
MLSAFETNAAYLRCYEGAISDQRGQTAETESHMKSKAGVYSVVALFLSFPTTVLLQALIPGSEGVTIHIGLFATVLLLSVAIGDFYAHSAVTRIASISLMALGGIFLLQAASEAWLSNEALKTVAFDISGGWLESALMVPFIVWVVAVLDVDSHGWKRAFGIVAIAAMVGNATFLMISYAGGSEASDLFKLLFLLTPLWLLAESLKPAEAEATTPRIAVPQAA